MKMAIVGGKLQGVEAAYLARKAGWEVLLVDRNPGVPASGLCDRFVRADVAGAGHNLDRLLDGVDLVMPALENDAALAALTRWTRQREIPFAFDPAAYAVSASKLASDRLFARAHVPAPRYWPECRLPVLAKPSSGSGSSGVQIFRDREAVEQMLQASPGPWVVQEFLEGPSYSIEVAGRPGTYRVFQVTDLAMDRDYDCKRVIAPTDLDAARIHEFETIGHTLAEAVSLNGLMDIEVILHGNTLKVLEIDARLPSQTPTAVFWSTGLNMVDWLGQLTLSDALPPAADLPRPQGVVYEHVRVTPGRLETKGEHVMGQAGPLHLHRDFFGADEAITDYAAGRDHWSATLIVSGPDRAGAWDRRNRVIREICRKFGISRAIDLNPADIGGRSSDPTQI